MTNRPHRVIHRVLVDEIHVPAGRREVHQEDVDRIAESMSRIGLNTPISIKVDAESETTMLIAGAHRLAAAKQLGWNLIECFHVEGDDIDIRMLEIAENLHRAELSVLERSEQIAEWAQLVAKRQNRLSDNLSEKPRGRPGAAAKTAEEVGINERAAQRALKIAALSDEAKHEARRLGLDNNQSALLEATKETTPEAQVDRLRFRRPERPDALAIQADVINRTLTAAFANAEAMSKDLATARAEMFPRDIRGFVEWLAANTCFTREGAEAVPHLLDDGADGRAWFQFLTEDIERRIGGAL